MPAAPLGRVGPPPGGRRVVTAATILAVSPLRLAMLRARPDATTGPVDWQTLNVPALGAAADEMRQIEEIPL